VHLQDALLPPRLLSPTPTSAAMVVFAGGYNAASEVVGLMDYVNMPLQVTPICLAI